MSEFGNKLLPGQKEVPARTVNDVTEALRRRQAQPRQNENQPRDFDQVKVENGSGYALDPFAVLKVEGSAAATWPERTNGLYVQEGMRNGVESKGSQPGDDFDQVAILQKSAPSDMFAQGVTSGPTPVFVYFPTEESLSYPFAIPDRGGAKSYLVASPYGLNRILWHAQPSDSFEECVGEVLQAFVNLGEDQQWHFWKLKADLPCCGSAQADACTECGTVYSPDCPITRTIWAPKGLNLCGCENACGQWKQGDVVPAWWYESLGKWVTIPNFSASFEEKEMEVVTGLRITGGTVRPTEDYKTVVTDVTIDTALITLGGDELRPLQCTSGSLSFAEGDAVASGNVTVSGNLGSAQDPVRLDVVSACDDVLLEEASITSEANLSLSGSLSGSASVSVPLSNISLPISGTCGGTASGAISVGGTANLDGTCRIWQNLPTLIVTGSVGISGSASLSGTVNVGTGAATLSSSSTAKTLLKNVTLKKDNATASAIVVPPVSGSITGTLSNSSTTQVSLSNVTISLNLANLFEEVDMVDPSTFSFSGCTLTWTTKKCLALKSGASLGSLTASLSGTLDIPSAVVCDFDHTSAASSYTLDTSTESVSIPDTVTIDGSKLTVSGTGSVSTTGTLTGSATWPENAELVGTCNVQGNISAGGTASLVVAGTISGTASGSSSTTATGTATITDTVTVSGPLSISSGVSINGKLRRSCPQYALLNGVPVSLTSTTPVSLGVSGTITDTRECYVEVPTSITWGTGWIDVDQEEVPFPGIDLTGATISGITDTITYLACKDCPEPEEEEEEAAS